MKTYNQQEELRMTCGKATDSYDKLVSICKEKSEELKRELDIAEQSVVTVSFWTGGMPELICVGEFSKNEDGEVVYHLDFSESTL